MGGRKKNDPERWKQGMATQRRGYSRLYPPPRLVPPESTAVIFVYLSTSYGKRQKNISPFIAEKQMLLSLFTLASSV